MGLAHLPPLPPPPPLLMLLLLLLLLMLLLLWLPLSNFPIRRWEMFRKFRSGRGDGGGAPRSTYRRHMRAHSHWGQLTAPLYVPIVAESAPTHHHTYTHTHTHTYVRRARILTETVKLADEWT